MTTNEPALASIGQNQQFLAAMGHIFAPAFILSSILHYRLKVPRKYLVILAIIGTISAAVKEFWYDATYEKNPPQTFMDNLQDFIGWTIGFWMGALV